MRTFGKRLHSLRKLKKISVAEISKHVGVSQSTYREWEYGRAIMGEPYILLSEALGVSLVQLMTGEKPVIEQEIEDIEERIKKIKTLL